jgi:ankyrin repeat protein
LTDAAQSGHLEVAEMLLAHGPDVNARTLDGETVLERARMEGHRGIYALLKEAGAKE